MNEIPKHWSTSTISEVVDINVRPKRDELDDDTLASFVPMKCVEAESGRFESPEDKKVGEVKKGYTPMRDGDVIFAKVTPCMENGKAVVVRGLTNGIGFGSTEFYSLRPKGGLLSDFLFYFIIQQGFRREAERHMTGAVGLRRVPKNFIAEHTIPLPPIPEQRRIVARIEELFSRLDAGVAALRHAKAQLQRYRQSVLAAAVTGQLTQAWREQHPDTEPAGELLERILEQRREQWNGRGKYKEPILDLPSDLPALPKSWTWSASGHLFECIVPNRDKPKSFTGTTPWITLPDFDGRIVIDHAVNRVGLTSAEIESSRARVVPAGSVIMSCIGRFGLAAVLGRDAVINQQLHAFLIPEALPARYFVYCLQAQKAFMESIATSTTIAYLNKSNCNRVPIALPPLDEQHQIVAEVEARTTAIDHLEAELDRQITRSNRLRQSTLSSAFKGRLTPQ
ncbi:MAG: type I restriction enzyme S subunit [Verrucomicrobiales bacterium]|jgi:type I restriction enzyme S subunit